MQQRVYLSVLILLCVSCLSVYAQNPACSISGDPHYTTFDKVYHDFQGFGTFVLANSANLEVHAQMKRCNFNAAKPVTCIRALAVKVTHPSTQQVVRIQWGSFGSEPAYPARDGFPATPASPDTVDDVIIEGLTVTHRMCQNKPATTYDSRCKLDSFINNRVSLFPDGSWTMVASGGSLIIEANTAARIQWARYWTVLTLPARGYAGGTNGLCGFFDGEASNEFVNAQGLNVKRSTVALTRYNDASTNAWGATWAVGQNNTFQPILNHFHLSGGQVSHMAPTAQVPTDQQQAALNTVDFASVQQVKTAEARCREINVNNDAAAFENCMYDIAALADADPAQAFAFAQSNQDSSNAATDTSSSSGLTDGQKAAIAVSIIGGVLLVVAGVLFIRLRRTRRELVQTKALVAQARGPQSESNLQLQENL